MDETFDPASLARSDTINSTLGSCKTAANAKSTKPAQTYPRIDFEHLYTDLKSLLNLNWEIYYEALTRFIQGQLSATEFGDLTDHFILATPATEHAHNSLICAILYNTCRDAPEPGLAAWVSSTSDKSAGASTSKPAITSDAGEQRLKTEVMLLPPRDRRRLKAVANEKQEEESIASRRNAYEEAQAASRIKVPDVALNGNSLLGKTNWDLEIKKRYQQPLFAESLEFPETSAIFNRMIPICYEESVTQGSSLQCAELVSVAAEIFIKDFLSTILIRVRSNGPKYDSGAGGGIFTARYKKQVAREAAAFKAGKLERDRDDDLLPVESKEAKARRPIGLTDILLANRVGPTLWNGMPIQRIQIQEAPTEAEYEDYLAEQEEQAYMDGAARNGSLYLANSQANPAIAAGTNGITNDAADDAMDIDEDDYGWEGSAFADRSALSSILDDCLAIRA